MLRSPKADACAKEGDLRRSERIEVGETTRMRPNEWSSIEVHVLDVSRCGFKAQCEARLMRGSVISIDIPGIGPVEAQVTWHRSGTIGARFLQPIDLQASGWRPVAREAVLVRLLRERAEARADGRASDELSLRRRILSALPMQTVGAPSPAE
jgi:hypothetical protein